MWPYEQAVNVNYENINSKKIKHVSIATKQVVSQQSNYFKLHHRLISIQSQG